MKLQSIVDGATQLLMVSKNEADQANRSIDYYTDLEAVERKIPRIKVSIVTSCFVGGFIFIESAPLPVKIKGKIKQNVSRHFK